MNIEKTYIAVKLSAGYDIFSVWDKIQSLDGLISCDAVKGEFDLILKFRSKPEQNGSLMNFLNQIARGLSVLTIQSPLCAEDQSEYVRDEKNKVYSYLYVEYDAELFDGILHNLRAIENIKSIEPISGRAILILLIEGNHYYELDKIVQNKINPIRGILRAIETSIIPIYEPAPATN
jgi:hypothetical protein